MSKTILMIHGFGAAGDSWAPVADSFKAAGYAVETPTIHAALRTVGPPPAGLAGKSLSDYVAEMSDLARSIAKRDGEKPVVFGHSMGGMIAQKLAEANLASGIVLFAPASPADARGKPKLSPVFTFLNIAATSKPETKAVKIWKTGFKWGVLNQTPAARHEAIFGQTVHDSGRALADLAYPDRDPNRAVHVDAAKVTVPVMILAGARDRTTPIEDVRLVARKYAGSTFNEYPNNAHWLIDEPGSAEILAEVKTWLEAKGLGAKAPEVKAATAKAPAEKPAMTVAAKPTPAPVPTAKAPAKTAAPKTAAKTAKPKAKATPEAAPPESKTPKTAAAAKPAPATASTKPKAAAKPAPAKTTEKAAPKAAAPAKPEVKPKAKAATPATAVGKTATKTPAKPAAKSAAPPKVAKASSAKAPPAKAVAPKTAKPEAAPAPAKAKPAAKPAAVKATAPAKAPAAVKAPAAPKTAPKAAKPAATKSTAKTSPKSKT